MREEEIVTMAVRTPITEMAGRKAAETDLDKLGQR